MRDGKALAKKSLRFLLFLVLLIPQQESVYAQRANRPFPQHTAYARGTIIPNHLTRDRLDDQTKTFFRDWKAKYVKQGCGAGRYYVATGDDHGSDTATVSEAHGYGMIILALMAGHDPDAKKIFDGMYLYFKDHPAAGTQYLMSWKQDSSCRDVEGNDSATDGDMDIAYALLLADKQWGPGAGINYGVEAAKIIQAIMRHCVHPTNFHILLGSWVLQGDSKYHYGTRTSDFIIHHMKAFERATGDSRWSKVVDKTYSIVTAIQNSFSSGTGLLPDFVIETNSSPMPVKGKYLERPTDGDYYSNACRVPWRLATDYLMSGDARAKAASNRINFWIRKETANNPARIRAGYKLNGGNIDGNDYTKMSFVAPFGVGAMIDASHQAWLNRVWDFVVNKPVSDETYYGNTLKLLAMLVMSGNWWAP